VLAVLAEAAAAVGRAAGAQLAVRLQLQLLRLRRMLRRIFLPTRMRCLPLLRHPRAAVVAVVVAAVAAQAMRQS